MKILNIGTARSEQTVQTQIRLLLEEPTLLLEGPTLFAIPSASFGCITECSIFRLVKVITLGAPIFVCPF